MAACQPKAAFPISRRTLLKAVVLAGADAFLAGCRSLSLVKHPGLKCPPAPSRVPPLTIDAHCHIFNGTDLQANDFLGQIVFRQQRWLDLLAKLVGPVIQHQVWHKAPNGVEELALLNQYPAANCPSGYGYEAQFEQREIDQFRQSREAVKKTGPYRKAQEKYDKLQLPAQAHAQPGSAAQPEAAKCIPETDFTPEGTLDYFDENYQYRYGVLQDYLDTFNNPNRPIDLMLANMVDYDWWLAKGKQTETSLETQVAVMEEISVLSHGRVHGFVPFDPLREVAYRAGHMKERIRRSSLDLVQDAVLKRGCIGVKLYPPMGFAPLGNCDVWKKHSEEWKNLKERKLPRWIKHPIYYPGDGTRRELGDRLDEALADLYNWCCENEVPVMAHSAPSNGGTPFFNSLAGPEYWQRALENYPTLRVSFGHLGDFDELCEVPTRATGFVNLMGSGTDHCVGTNAFADVADYSVVINNSNGLKDRILSFYKPTAETNSGILARRLMYGTDWDLLLDHAPIGRYLQQFMDIFNEVDAEAPQSGVPTGKDGLKLSERFFGWNAVDWLGLRSGGAARSRLEQFYRNHGGDPVNNPPTWMQKVDEQSKRA